MTHEQKIAHVACFYKPFFDARDIARFREKSITDAEIREGSKLGREMEEEYSLLCGVYGHPEYGSWPEGVKMPVKERVIDMLQGKKVEVAA